MIVEIQYFHGCPHSGELLENVRTAVSRYDGECELTETLVETPEKAKEVGFRGSPTLLINGDDFEGMPAPANPALACRVYESLPSTHKIINRLQSP